MTQLNGKILIVDDEPLVLEAIVNVISTLEVDIVTAKNGKAALDIVHSQPIDVVITDLKMPEMSGIEFLTQLRKEHYGTLVIFVTVYGDRDLVREAWNQGAFDFIDKPFEIDHLRNVTKSALLYGKTYFAQQYKESNKFTEVCFHVDEDLTKNFQSICDKKNLNKDSIINSLIAKWVASNTASN